MVLNNDCVFGTVNANRSHYEMGLDALARALITINSTMMILTAIKA